MVTLVFSGNHTDTYSAPFYNYDGDTVYVGDDSSYLHTFTGVFYGTPAEVTTSHWPVNLNGGKPLSSPVYDFGTGNVIVGDFGGVLHSVTASSGAVYGTTVSVGDVIADAPLVDGGSGKVYAFVTTGSAAGVNGDNAVLELQTDFTTLTTPAAAIFEPVGTGGTGYYLYAGTFDNVYYSSANSTGSIYVVGNTGVTTGANLYRIPISASVMAAPVTAVSGLTVSGSGASPWPSPVTEFCNNGASACVASATATSTGTDYIFFSVNRGNVGGCATAAGNGCVLSYNVSNPAAVTISNSSNSGLNVITPSGGNGCWATSGLVVDNSSTLAGASQTYFIGLGTNLAGGSTGPTSSKCITGTAATIGATQASQLNP
jgi:hypothetical protein